MTRLLAISDLHVTHPGNLEALDALPAHPDDWLIVAGDVAERCSDVEAAWSRLVPRFAKVIWVPGNHELWSRGRDSPRGVAKYAALVRTCRAWGVHTPEDPWLRWPRAQGPPLVICPLFLLYDYSFAPDGMSPEQAVAWAAEDRIRCVDEVLLHPDPFETRQAWCAARLAATRSRLNALPADHHTILINHFPLRRDLVRLYRIPRFTPWCGTRATEDWHRRYRAEVVVTGHLHMRATDWRDGVRFEEVSLGYPRHWRDETGVEGYLRQILPHPPTPPPRTDHGPTWHR